MINQLEDKLGSENRNFALLQFQILFAGFIATLYFYTTHNYLASELTPLVTLGLVGFLDFFIHRNDEYVRGGDFDRGDKYKDFGMNNIKNFIGKKSKHWTTYAVVPGCMISVYLVLAGIAYQSFLVNYAVSTSSWRVKVFGPLAVVATVLFFAGAQLGKLGWDFKRE